MDLICKSRRSPPPENSPYDDIFLEIVKKDLRELCPKKHGTTRNITTGELEALISLENNDKITIKPSDKGSNIVVLDSGAYREMCLNILGDRECYEFLQIIPQQVTSRDWRKLLIGDCLAEF